MTDPVRVLYVGSDASTGRRLESLFADRSDRRPAIALSFVTSVESALRTLRVERIDHVVLASQSEWDDAEEVIRREAPGVEVTALEPDAGGETDDAPDRLQSTRTGRVHTLARRIRDAVASETAASDDVGAEHFRALAAGLPDAILVVDTDSTVRYANPAVSEMFGYDPDELVGEPLTELMPPDFAERYREGLEQYLCEGERHVDWSYVELTGQRRDGTEVPLGVSFSEFDAGDERLFTGIVRDISGQRHRESTLRDRVRQQEALAEFSRHALEDRSVAELMDEAVELVADALDNEYCKVLELRPETDDLLLRAGVGWRDGLVGSATVDTERESQAGYTLVSERPVVVEDLTTEDRFSGPELLTSHDVRSGISTIIGSSDDPWGILGTHDVERRSYTDHDVQFVESVANVLTTAIRRREREAKLERHEAMVNAVGDGVYALDADSRYVAANDAYLELTGYDREELLGTHAGTVVGPETYENAQRLQEALDGGEDAVTLEATMPTADGESVPVEARISAFPLGDGTGRVGVVRDVSDRKRREEKLTSLHELLRSLADAETPADICDLAVAAAVETLELPNAAVALYDDETGTLVPTARQWRGEDIDDALLGRHAEDVAWQAFVDGRTRAFDDLGAEVDDDTEMASALVIPLGKHGAFVAASPERAAFDATDRSFADIFCSNLESALDRAEREETLRKRRNDLEAKNRELERLDRINRVIREVTRALTRAASQDDVIQAVCDGLTDGGPYRFAWFGVHDRATGEMRPAAWAGVEDGYLDAIRVTANGDEDAGRGPAGRAVRAEELQVQSDLLGDPPFEPWREQALKRGYRSVASVPVVYEGTLRGVLNLYADEADAFDGTERTVLSELGETIGYALNALEQERALVSERSIELDFRIAGTGNPVFGFVAETGAEFEFENAVQNGDGRLRVFFTVRDATPEETTAFAEDIPWVEEIRLVTDRDGESLYECTLSSRSFLRSLVSRGAMPRTISITEDGGRFVVRLPRNTDVRPFVDLFEDHYDEAELVARRECDEPVMARHEFETRLDDRLTDRQREVLQTAYFSGFFEWPRESTAEEIADALGVSQPTVSRHIRAGEQALFGLLFDDE